MQRYFRPVLALLMALMLVVTAQSMALARNMTSPTGEMVLCTGTGPTIVQIDADGNPTGPAHLCPDCAMSVFELSITAPFAGPDRVLTGQQFSTQHTAHLINEICPNPSARAPPKMA